MNCSSPTYHSYRSHSRPLPMSISMALLSPPSSPCLQRKTYSPKKPLFNLNLKKTILSFSTRVAADNGAGVAVSVEKPIAVAGNGAVAGSDSASEPEAATLTKFKDPRWVAGTWDLKQFQKDGTTNWDAVIDAEVRRRKLLEDNPESSSNDDPIVFDTSIIPWWAWVKRFHLPEAELLNGRAAMIGFFMAYFVDSLTGVGLVDQMGNFFCKTLLFVAVLGVLLIRKNEDIDKLKKLIDETTFYDKQWQATWQDEVKKD